MLLGMFAVATPYIKLSTTSQFIMEVTANLGAWLNGTAFLISAVTGYGTALAPTVHKLFPFPNGIEGSWSEVVTG